MVDTASKFAHERLLLSTRLFYRVSTYRIVETLAGIYFGGLLKRDSKSILVDFILAVGHRCWIIDICTIFPTHCFMDEFAIMESNPHDFTYSINSCTISFDKVGTTDGKQGLPFC